LLFTEENHKENSISQVINKIPVNPSKVWKMYFDGTSSKYGSKVGIYFISPTKHSFSFSYKLNYETTNNATEYKALILVLEKTKKLNIDKLSILGDSELIIHQVKALCQTKHPHLRAYRNQVWDFEEFFLLVVNFTAIPRDKNQIVDSLVVTNATFKPSNISMLKFEIEMIYRPFILDNTRHWQVFEDNEQIKKFIDIVSEFSEENIDEDG
jgi:ribonuclease HI